jgi:hypothetical protein
VARTLKKERILSELESSGTITPNASYHNILSDDENEDDITMELKSINSEDIHTFLTEPKFKKHLLEKRIFDKTTKLHAPILEVRTSYKKGDFIGRNIAVNLILKNSWAGTQDIIMH